jgi:alcohol dehydrogenase
VAITTTAGTGTEADPWTVITNGDEKIGFGYDKTFPVLSIVDPELMLSVPPALTAYQGFDALFHSTEGYVNRTANEMSDLFSLKAISLIGNSLAKAVSNGSDKRARGEVALANTLSGFVESTSGCISAHSIEHALSGAAPQLPHGAGLILISLAYYTFLAHSGACESRMVDMARALGKTDAKVPMDFVAALSDLQKACNVAEIKLSEYGIKRDQLPGLAKRAREIMGGLFEVDPVLITQKDVEKILADSYR